MTLPSVLASKQVSDVSSEWSDRDRQIQESSIELDSMINFKVPQKYKVKFNFTPEK